MKNRSSSKTHTHAHMLDLHTPFHRIVSFSDWQHRGPAALSIYDAATIIHVRHSHVFKYCTISQQRDLGIRDADLMAAIGRKTTKSMKIYSRTEKKTSLRNATCRRPQVRENLVLHMHKRLNQCFKTHHLEYGTSFLNSKSISLERIWLPTTRPTKTARTR